jgi:hypothetical protein
MRYGFVQSLLMMGLVAGACSDDDDASGEAGRSDASHGDASPQDGGEDVAADSPADGSNDAASDGGDGLLADAEDGGDSPTDVRDDSPAAATLYLQGAAEGEDSENGFRAECSFSGQITELVFDGASWSGFASGEVFRIVYPTPEGRQEFSALVAGPATLVADPDGEVALRWVGDQSEGVRFWQYMEVLLGQETEPLTYEGRWQCAPLDIEDFQDTYFIVNGAWQLSPTPP